MKKKAIVAIALCLCILCGSYALAVNYPLGSFTVAVKTAQYITNAKKADDEQRWYVTITSMSITEGDRMYMNVRKSQYGDRLSKALSFTGAAAKSASYSTTTAKDQSIFLHAQLDSSSWTPDSFAVVNSGRWSP